MNQEKFKATEKCADNSTPVLINITEELLRSINHLDELTIRLNEKLQSIHFEKNPENEEGEQPCAKIDVTTFSQGIMLLISRLENYNKRLDFSINHLYKII